KNRRLIAVRRACARVGEAAAAPLAELLEHRSPRVRIQAALCLRKIGRAAQAAVPALLEALKDPDQGVRTKAAQALKETRPHADAGTDQLRDALADDNHDVRRVASKVLRSMRAGGAVVGELADRLNSPDPAARRAAISALAALDTAEAVAPVD